MSRRGRILGVLVAGLALAVLGLGVVLGYDSPCEPAEPLPAGATPMKAIVYRCYGPPEVLALEEIAKPAPAQDEVLVKVEAAAINPLDWHYMRGQPYFMRLFSGIGKPKVTRFGVDFAGTVEAVGADVTRFKVGDPVFGGRSGALAEYVVAARSKQHSARPLPSFIGISDDPVQKTPC